MTARIEAAFTIDMPVPYRLSDLIKLIENRMDSLAERENISSYKRLKARIEAVSFDPRYAFMFSQRTIKDTMTDVFGRLFRVPADGKPITIMEIADFPTEVVDALVAVLCRLTFDFNVWSNGALLVVCEEAHRYIPASKALGFGPTRKAISRIAKEGRKYNLSICLVSQRPFEIDPTILSQCNTIFAMRMSNDADQAIIRAAVVESAAGMLTSLPSIGERKRLHSAMLSLCRCARDSRLSPLTPRLTARRLSALKTAAIAPRTGNCLRSSCRCGEPPRHALAVSRASKMSRSRSQRTQSLPWNHPNRPLKQLIKWSRRTKTRMPCLPRSRRLRHVPPARSTGKRCARKRERLLTDWPHLIDARARLPNSRVNYE